ncbi:hypothetical protein GWI33_017909 [Rhynchophorus ferrugineus]|uniref:Uncharacterized protein n=1 Tax=Rhynchophorus ferrugineus TaxID=354439 RepID=A0A834HXB0_RHYFE|nr:hypothetical protein GWI33_017909 [Rhynchophorus ferrugineus]
MKLTRHEVERALFNRVTIMGSERPSSRAFGMFTLFVRGGEKRIDDVGKMSECARGRLRFNISEVSYGDDGVYG